MWRWEITEDAARDLEDIRSYVCSYSGDTARADELLDRFEALFDELCEHPFLRAVYQFPKGYEPIHEYRSANLGRYKVFYRVEDGREVVLVYRVRHVASDFTRAGL